MAMTSVVERFGGIYTRYYGTAAPSLSTELGPYNVGDEVIHTDPAGGEYRGWVCTVAGATGDASTWKGFGTLQA